MDVDRDLADSIGAAAELVAGAGHVVALVGAGLSVESGVPTFRGPDGLWARLGQPSTQSYQMFLEDPAGWWRQYLDPDADPARTEFRLAIERAEPNAGHVALADLERMGILKRTITQNVDNLHQRAGSTLLSEIHGNRTKMRCIECESRWPLAGARVDGYPPACPECRGLVKSDTVMFGEPIPRGVLEEALRETDECDRMMLVGTSASVYPAARLPERVLARGGLLIEANPGETPLSSRCDVVLRGPTGETLPALVERVKALMGARSLPP